MDSQNLLKISSNADGSYSIQVNWTPVAKALIRRKECLSPAEQGPSAIII